MKTRTVVFVGGALALAAGAAIAQPYDHRRGREPVATLYEFPNFQGREVTIYGSEENLSNVRFNDRAMSGRFHGRWRICEHADFGGHCRDVRGDVGDFHSLGLAQRVSSVQAELGVEPGYPGGHPGGYPGGWRPDTGWRSRPAEGARNVFFAYPSIRGMDVAAGSNAANTFCRRNGLGPAVYFDSSQRAVEAVDGEGRFVRDTPVLRDLLCRK